VSDETAPDDSTFATFVTAAPAPLVDVPTTSDPLCSFVFVTYGTGPIVVQAITSLVASLRADDVTFEIIVVDNEHAEQPDRTFRQLIVDTAGVRIVRPGRNLGFGSGCNLGVERSNGPLICLVNPDVEFESDWLTPLRTTLDDGAAIAAPVLVDPGGAIQSAGHHLWADGSTAPVTEVPSSNVDHPPDYASAACWLLTRATFDELGGFDPAFHPAYYEDVDLALRSRALGGTAIVEQVRVVHHRGASTSDAAAPDTTPQRRRLLAKWPDLATTQPTPPA
jgi:GT2 family glycosyltransferase